MHITCDNVMYALKCVSTCGFVLDYDLSTCNELQSAIFHHWCFRGLRGDGIWREIEDLESRDQAMWYSGIVSPHKFLSVTQKNLSNDQDQLKSHYQK